MDSSDVFLLQASGRRRWSVQLEYVEEAAQSDEAGVCRTLPHFKADAAWVLEPGDVLYVPPFIPHEGVALGGAVASRMQNHKENRPRDSSGALAG